MAAHDGASSSFSGSSYTYDVFLSFRGPDTGNSFTAFLHNFLKKEGVDVYIDREDLRAGEEINSALVKAIRGSKISIPVFSKGYADSRWCLDELVEIVQCHRDNSQRILPIFFEVDPKDVRHQIGCYKISFEKHKDRFDEQTINSWKEALKEVAAISGYDLSQVTGNQSKLVDLIVKRVLSESSGKRLDDVKNPIGLDARVEKIKDLLCIGSNDVQFVGICGIGGIGKTTIAKTLYNRIFKSFHRSCFLANIREEALGSKGLVHLQEQLICSISKWKVDGSIANVHRGRELIIEKLQGETVLLILDDVDSRSQLDALAVEFKWFGSASKIIITSRDKHILELAKVDEDKIYWPEELDDKQSLQLFSLHAFLSDRPPEEYLQLSLDVIQLAGGLPLTLEVLGSSLFGIRENDVWQSMLRNLKNIPNREVHQTLKISYDNLQDDEKSMFLDAACFFIGWRKETIISMWEACGFEAISAINKLTQRSLIKFTNKVSYGPYRESMSSYRAGRMQSYDELRMHDQIQAMGRGIVLEESPRKPGKRSRIWSGDDILEVLEEQMGTQTIEGILPSSNEYFGVQLHSEVFAKMSELRYLSINEAKSKADVPHLPSNLIWFSWRGCGLEILPTDFYLKKLVHMDLSYNWRIRQAWVNKPQNEKQRFQKLKVLNLQNCRDLRESPDFSWFPSLEKLDLQSCRKLANLHPSIGDIKSLVELHLGDTNIKELPDSICKLSSLKRLILGFCYPLKKLPESIGNLKSLVELDLYGTKIGELPDTICRLSSLKRLFLGMCSSLKELPKSIGDLKSLIDLDLSQTKIEELPDSICSLSSLNMLDLYLCPSLKKLPDSICNLNSLVSLVLQMVSTGPESLPELPSTLTHLLVQNCVSFQKADFSSLKKLRILRISGCKKLEEIKGLKCTESLEEFHLSTCDIIESLPELPSSLTTLEVVASNSVQKLLDLSSLKKLRILSLRSCEKFEEIRGLDGTESLEEFHLLDCDTIESILKLPSTLTFIRVINCISLQKLPDLSTLKYLRTLRLHRSKLFQEIRGLEGTESLALLDVDHCNNLTDTPWKILGQGKLLVDGSQRSDSLNVNDGIYKGLILCLVFAFPLMEAQKVQGYLQEGQPAMIHIYSTVLIHGKHRRTECVVNMQVEGIEYTTERDLIYIHHFKGFDWFGFPLEGKDAIEKISLRIGGSVIPYKVVNCEVKFWKLLLESTESEQQMLNPESSARMVADFFSWSFGHAERSPSTTVEEARMVSSPYSHDGESSNSDGESSYHSFESSYEDGESSYHDCESSYDEGESSNFGVE